MSVTTLKSVLVIAPHGDDEVLGAGGTITKHIKRGDTVTVCFVKAPADKRETVQLEDAFKVKEILQYQNIIHLNLDIDDIRITAQLIAHLDNVISIYRPDIIYCPWYGDLHQDHRIISQACSSSTRLGNNFHVKQILLYEIPSSTDQGFCRFETSFVPNFYNCLEEVDIKIKCKGMNTYTLEALNLRSEEAI